MIKRILIFFIFASSLFAKEEGLTNFVFKGGAYINPTVYQSNFTQLPNIDNCCTTFDFGFGVNPMFTGGFEYIFCNELFGRPYRYSFELGYAGLSGDYSIEEFIGNNINEDSYEKIFSEYVLEANLSYIITSHSLYVYFMDDDRLAIAPGFTVGYPMDYTFYQVERLDRPSGITFENGTDKRKEAEGEIPNIATPYFALNLALRYEFYKSGPLSIASEMKLNYGLSNLVSSLDWKAHTLAAGVSLMYTMPKARPPVVPPANPPMPDLKMPQAPMEYEIAMKVFGPDGEELKDKDTLSWVGLEFTRQINFVSVPATMLFEKNSAEPNTYSIRYLSQNYFKDYDTNSTKMNIKIYSTSDEDKSVVAKRREFVEEVFGADNVNISSEIINVEKLPHDELAAEYRRFEVVGRSTLNYEVEQERIPSYNFPKGRVIIESNSGREESIKTVVSSADTLIEFAGNEFEFRFTDFTYGEKPRILKIETIAKNNDGLTASAEKEINLNMDVIVDTAYVGYEESEDTFTLCYFDFNSSQIKYYDRRVLDYLREQAANGYKLEIYGYTDDLGEEDYNDNLAAKRARAAKELIGKNVNSEIVIPEGYPYPNESPYKRMANRVVLVKIKK